ncbi:MAG: hypothetical protein ACE5G0_18000 [Rhodothermales bacterium]
MLFADLKGSMELLADRDPEEARKLLDPRLERMMEATGKGVSEAAGKVATRLAEGGAGRGTAWDEQTARCMLGESGFTAIEVVDAPGPQNSTYICRK